MEAVSLAAMLRVRRAIDGVSQQTAAEKLKIHRQTLSGWEHGVGLDADRLSVRQCAAIASYLGVGMEEVMEKLGCKVETA